MTRDQNMDLGIYETERVILKSLSTEDITPEYVSWWNDPVLQKGLGWGSRNWTHQQAVAHVKSFQDLPSVHFGIFLKPENRLVGFYTVNIEPHHKISSSNTVIGDRSLWRQGLAEEISKKMIEVRFLEVGIEKIEGKVQGDNKRSKALFKKLGFKKEGVLRKHGPGLGGKRLDTTLYGLCREDWLAERKTRGGVK